MLLELFQLLKPYISGFNLFGYLTLRAILAAITALVVSLLIGPPMIRKLAAYKVGQTIRNDGPQSHFSKAGTPTMGGTLILFAVICLVFSPGHGLPLGFLPFPFLIWGAKRFGLGVASLQIAAIAIPPRQ